MVLLLTGLFAAAGCRTDQPGPASDGPAAGPPVVVSAETDRTTATVRDPITYTLTLHHDPGVIVRLPEVGTRIAGLRIVDIGGSGPEPVDTVVRLKKWYRLRADLAGTYIIPSLTIPCTLADGTPLELKTPQIFLQVTAARGPAPEADMQDIRDIKPLQQARRDMRPWFAGAAIGIGVLALAAAVLLYVRARRRRQSAPPVPAHEQALAELDRLAQERLFETGGFQEHYFRLSEILRRYLENRFHVPAVEQTTQELLPALAAVPALARRDLERCRTFLERADLIKFARSTPSARDAEESCQDVGALVIDTSPKLGPGPENTRVD